MLPRRLSLLALLAICSAASAQTERDVYDSFLRANALKTAFKFDEAEAEEAEKFFRRSLIIRNKTEGPDSPVVAQSLNNLGLVLHEVGNFVESEQMHKRALEIREKAHGADHPNTAESLNNLAILYRDL